MFGIDLAAVAALIVAVGTLTGQLYGILRKRKSEKRQLEEAATHAPQVMEQLELGNVGEAVKHVLAISDGQAKEIERLQVAQSRLQLRNDALEAEVDGYERIVESQAREMRTQKVINDDLRAQVGELKAQVAELQRQIEEREP